jgi:hypothetical protein
MLLGKIVKMSGIKKRVHLHLFRKSRITEMIVKGYKEAIVKEMNWGNQGTKMLATYVRLSNEDISHELLRMQGVTDEKVQPDRSLDIWQCPECKEINSPTITVCSRCQTPLDGSEEFSDKDNQSAIEHKKSPKTRTRRVKQPSRLKHTSPPLIRISRCSTRVTEAAGPRVTIPVSVLSRIMNENENLRKMAE